MKTGLGSQIQHCSQSHSLTCTFTWLRAGHLAGDSSPVYCYYHWGINYHSSAALYASHFAGIKLTKFSWSFQAKEMMEKGEQLTALWHMCQLYPV